MQMAKCIITDRGQSKNHPDNSKSPSAYRQGDKGPNNAHTEKKGRDASGASEGAEALIAGSDFSSTYECFRNQHLSAKGAPL